MTETLLQIWLWSKVIGIAFCTLLVGSIIIFACIVHYVERYTPIRIKGKGFVFRETCSTSGSRTVQLFHTGFWKKKASATFVIGTLNSSKQAIHYKVQKGEVPWIQPKKA